MDIILPELTSNQWVFCLSATLFAGMVKGLVGFALPMILISLLSATLSPDLALAGLMLPTLITNAMQALRDGPRAAWAALVQFRVILLTAAVMLIFAAQIYAFLPVWVLLAVIGAPVFVFSALQLAGWKAHLNAPRRGIELGVGGFAGFVGGLSGVWGPPIVAYLTALGTEKHLQMRAQGVAFGLGTVLLILAHGPSGVVRTDTMTFSALLCCPAVLGMVVGRRLQDRIDQQGFRTATLWVLLLAGLNLIRRAFFV